MAYTFVICELQLKHFSSFFVVGGVVDSGHLFAKHVEPDGFNVLVIFNAIAPCQ